MIKYATVLTALFAALAMPAHADGDIDAGKKVFRKCQACHMVGEDAKAKVGPHLNDLLGRTAGTAENFGGKYSKAMVEAGENGLVWTEDVLMEYLIKPREYVKGTKMAFTGLKDEEDRADVIAYIKQYSPDYSPAE